MDAGIRIVYLAFFGQLIGCAIKHVDSRRSFAATDGKPKQKSKQNYATRSIFHYYSPLYGNQFAG
jgi:hypothetical protein